MIYSDETIQTVRQNSDIVDVVSDYVSLEKKGKNNFGLCPFHREKTASFSVDDAKQMFFCFSCNKGGDVIKFVMDIERLNFGEAVEKLAQRAGIELPEERNDGLAAKRTVQKRILDMNTEAARFFHDALVTHQGGKTGRAYFQTRNITPATIRKFGLGFSPPDWDTLHRHLLDKGYGADEQLEAGLVLKNKHGGLYDRFRGRVMFPIINVAGKVIGFGGRVLDDSVPKYMNSPETTVYNKGRNLYGLNFAKQTKKPYIILVEGYMDLISLCANGIDCAVAPLGTSLTEAQSKLLKRYTGEVVVAFDSDTAGQAATLRSLDLLDDQGFRVRVLSLPSGKDPDEYIQKNGTVAFQKLVDQADSLIGYKVSMLRKRYPKGDVDNDLQFLDGAITVLAGIKSEVEREIYARQIAKQYQVSEHALLSDTVKRMETGAERKGTGQGSRSREGIGRDKIDSRTGSGMSDSGRARPDGDGGEQQTFGRVVHVEGGKQIKERLSREQEVEKQILKAELFVIALLSYDNSLLGLFLEKMPQAEFQNQEADIAFRWMSAQLHSGVSVQSADLIRHFNPENADLFSMILQKECHCEDNRKALEQKIKDINVMKQKRKMREILRKMGNELKDEKELKDKIELKDERELKEERTLKEVELAELNQQLAESVSKINKGKTENQGGQV